MVQIDVAPVKATITIDDLEKVDVRVGTIRRVEEIPGSRNLMKLTVNFGDHERTILAGIKGEREDPYEIQDKQALFVVNLEPRTMMGERSEGMLFDIGYNDGLPSLPWQCRNTRCRMARGPDDVSHRLVGANLVFARLWCYGVTRANTRFAPTTSLEQS